MTARQEARVMVVASSPLSEGKLGQTRARELPRVSEREPNRRIRPLAVDDGHDPGLTIGRAIQSIHLRVAFAIDSMRSPVGDADPAHRCSSACGVEMSCSDCAGDPLNGSEEGRRYLCPGPT